MSSKNSMFILSVLLSGNIFAATTEAEAQPQLDASCTAKEFETIKLKQNCLLKPGKDNSCFVSTMVDAMQGSAAAQANLNAFSADLPEDLRNRLSRVVEKVNNLSQPGSRVPISESLSKTIANSSDSPRAWSNVIASDQAQQIVRQALQEQFPAEMDQLRSLENEASREIQKSRQTYEVKYGRSSEMYSSWNKHYWNGGQRELEDKIVDQVAHKKAELFQKNLKLKLASQLLDGVRAFDRTITSDSVSKTLEAIAKDEKSKVTAVREAKRYQFIDDRYPIERENLVSSAASGKGFLSRFSVAPKAVAGNVALMGVTLFGSSIFEKVQDRSRLNKCQGYFGFSNQELDYLKDGSFYSLRVKTSENCSDFGLFTEDPMLEYKNLLKKFNGVPAGICKMVKASLERLNNLSPELKVSKSSCSTKDISGNGFKITTSDNSKRMIQITTSAGQEYSLPWNDQELYPDFLAAGKFGKSDSAVLQRQLGDIAAKRLVKYGDGSGGNYVFSPEKDLLSPCDESTFCEIRQRVAVARTAVSQQKTFCEQFTPGPATAVKPAAAAGAAGSPGSGSVGSDR